MRVRTSDFVSYRSYLTSSSQQLSEQCRQLANMLNEKAVCLGIVWSRAVTTYGPGALDRSGGQGLLLIHPECQSTWRSVAFIQLRVQMGKLARQNSF